MRAQTEPTCTPAGCTYPMVVGLMPGVDVSIDGDIWPGSPYDEHIKVCPADGWGPTEAHETAESDERESGG